MFPSGRWRWAAGVPILLGRVPGLGATGGQPDVTHGNPTFGLLVSNLAPGAQPTLLLGASPAWLGYTLPLDLALLGLPGCTLYVSPDVMIPLFANGAQPAAAYIPLPVPVAPAASGAWIGVQAYVPTTAGSSFPGVPDPRSEARRVLTDAACATTADCNAGPLGGNLRWAGDRCRPAGERELSSRSAP